MYRVVKLSSKVYALKIPDVIIDEDNINTFVEEGTPVLICNELEDLEHFNIYEEDIEIVQPE